MVTPAMNYRPSFCIVIVVIRIKPTVPAGPDSVSLKDYRNRTHISRERVSQLVQVLHQVRILYLSKTTEIKLTIQENVSVNSFRVDVST